MKNVCSHIGALVITECLIPGDELTQTHYHNVVGGAVSKPYRNTRVILCSRY